MSIINRFYLVVITFFYCCYLFVLLIFSFLFVLTADGAGGDIDANNITELLNEPSK